MKNTQIAFCLAFMALPLASTAAETFLSSGHGGPVRSHGECVISAGGTAIEGCGAAPEVKMEPAPVVVAPAPAVPQVQVITLSADANFDFDKSDLKSEGRARLDQLAADLRGADSITAIDITGHTDSIGSTTYNQRLSERRAATVRNYLVAQGVSDGLISMRGMGETSPIATNSTKEGRAQNRRVEVGVTGSKTVIQ